MQSAGTSVSSGSPIRHVGLQWVSDQACWFTRGLRLGSSASDGFLVMHIGLSGYTQTCLKWVSNQACWSPMGLRQVSDNNNIFVCSLKNK